MKQRVFTGWVAALVLTALSLTIIGCYTVKGAGRDIEALGEGVQDIADDDDSPERTP